jgi:hypothetical protein
MVRCASALTVPEITLLQYFVRRRVLSTPDNSSTEFFDLDTEGLGLILAVLISVPIVAFIIATEAIQGYLGHKLLRG